jgi:GntR family transcriptional regulator
VTGGTWVSTSSAYVVPQASGEADAWTKEAGASGRRGTQRVVHAGEAAAPEGVARGLGRPVGEPVVVRQRIILLDDRVVELTDTYYPADIARGSRLADPRKIPGGAVTLLHGFGYAPRQVREEVGARLADERERDVLGLSPGDPVLCLTRITRNEDRAFQMDVSVFPAAHQRLRYEMRID